MDAKVNPASPRAALARLTGSHSQDARPSFARNVKDSLIAAAVLRITWCLTC
jgi:hypothetical protein